MSKEKKTVSAAQSIRDAITDNPKATPREILDIVTGKGVTTTIQAVYQARTKLNPAPETATDTALSDDDALLEVQKVVKKVGGVERLKERLSFLQRLAA